MDLVTRAGRRVGDVSRAEWLAHFRAPASRRNGEYCAMIDAWLRQFPSERLVVGFTEEARERPRELLGRIFRHVGLDPDLDALHLPAGERIAAGPGAPLPDALREVLEPLFAGEIQRLAARFGGPARAWLR
jgi:hypothetical protein